MWKSTTSSARIAHLVAVFVLFLAARATAAQDRPYVGLRCELAAPSLVKLWGAGAAGSVADNLCLRLENRLEDHPVFGFWDFRRQASAVAAATLHFEVRDGNAEDTYVRLQFRPPTGRDPRPWDAEWREPGEGSLRRDPLPREAPALLEEIVVRRLLDRYRVQIESHLKRVPLAETWHRIVGVDVRPRVLSTLPWQEFRQLRASQFRIACDWPRRGAAAYLHGAPLPTPSWLQPAGRDPYQVLTVVARDREWEGELEDVEAVRDEVEELQPRLLYLTTYSDPDLEVYTP